MCHPPLLQLNGLLMTTNCSMKCVIHLCCNLYVQICNYISRFARWGPLRLLQPLYRRTC
ncbi:hypothetical protein HanRHA438_Chr07g0316361 [Helianthus annuus]|nr:hypothetical protein HanRHA438_Chr07g0316361 [Helianthus annuus]